MPTFTKTLTIRLAILNTSFSDCKDGKDGKDNRLFQNDWKRTAFSI